MPRKSYPSEEKPNNRSLEVIYRAITDIDDDPVAPDPWEQREQEPDFAYAAFEIYLLAIPRTLRRVVQQLHKAWVTEEKEESGEADFEEDTSSSDEDLIFRPQNYFDPEKSLAMLHQIETSVASWSRVFEWKDRASKFDIYRDYADDMLKVHKRAATTKMHLGIADLMLAKARERLETLNPASLSPKILAEFVKVAVDIQRVSLDLSTQNVFGIQETRVTGDVNVNHNETVIERIMGDEQSRILAQSLAERLMDGAPDSTPVDISDDQ